jgi:hypothetical protein
MPRKIDFKKDLKALYAPSAKEVSVVNVPKLSYLSIDGKGDPNTSQDFKEAVEALYPVAYKIKFTAKKELGKDYTVMPLEGLWWAGDMRKFSTEDKSSWLWKVLIMQPDFITPAAFQTAVDEVKAKKNLPGLNKIRLEALEEGQSAQILYIGPFANEGPTIARIHDYIKNLGGSLTQKHHEIYLSDMRRTAPEKLKTIIRQPFREKCS